MGLDMYLSRKTYVKNWSFYKPEEMYDITITKNGKPVDSINVAKISYIEEEIAYWRKANAIHNWFVENVQEGADDCDTYYVDESKLKELVDICKKIISTTVLIDGKVKNGQRLEDGEWIDILEDGKLVEDVSIAEELLPTTSGFFFGSTEYDEYYIQDLKETVEMLEPYLEKGGDFYYHASW